MHTQMTLMLRGCVRCQVFEGRDPKPPLVNISTATQPMDLVHIDFVGMETTVSMRATPNVQKVLVVVDHFPCYVQAYKIENKTALATAKCLYDTFFRHFGFPQSLMSDRGKEFCNKIIKSLCSYLSIKRIRTTPYHPQSNGSVERTHQTLQRMIAKLDMKQHKNWPDHLSSITLAYNATHSMITGYWPYFLMMGCRPRLPIDLLFPTSRSLPGQKGIHKYVNALYSRLKEAICLARRSTAEDASMIAVPDQ